MKSRVGSFNVTTAVAGSTVAVTGFGFTPVAGRSLIQFWWNGRTEVVNTVGNASHRRGVGYSTGPALNYCVSTKSKDAVALSDTASDQHEIRCVEIINASTNTVDGDGHVSSYDADGFTFFIDDQFGQSFTVHYKAYEGIDIEACTYGIITEPGGVGTVRYTFPGRRPDALIAVGNNSTVLAGITTDSRMNQGYATFAKGAIQQFTFSMGSDDNVSPTTTANYAQDGQFLSMLDSATTNVSSRARVTAVYGDGFDLTWDEVSGFAREWQVLAISGGQWLAGSTVTVAAGNNITITGVPFIPRGYTLVTSNRVQPASDTPSVPDEWGMGAVDQDANQMSMAVEDATAVATTLVATVVQFDSVLATPNGVIPAPPIDSRITHTNFTNDGWVDAQPTSDGVGRWIGYFTEGDAVPIFLKRDDYTRLRM